MNVVRTRDQLAALLGSHQCVFVPTMGALHAGHAALIRHAVSLRADPDRVVVSIFVNPTQFGDEADLARYPRTLDADADLCAGAGADIIFAPDVSEVYPPGRDTPIPPLPAVAICPGLEDARRPGHFAGVCQVVARLFELTRPRIAVFGEKDWQQFMVIRAMVATAPHPGMPAIVGVPTIREPDGLAMSSRNRFLSDSDRRKSVAISRALAEAATAHRAGDAEARMSRVLNAAGLAVEYAVVRDELSLMPLPPDARAGRALIAARVGSVRLIDNAAWTASGT